MKNFKGEIKNKVEKIVYNIPDNLALKKLSKSKSYRK